MVIPSSCRLRACAARKSAPLAGRAGVSVADIVAANGWPDGSDRLILPGDVIELPAGSTAVAPQPTSPTTAPENIDTATTTVPSGDDAPPPANGTLACDVDLIAAGIDDDFVSIDGFVCDQGWAGVGYIDDQQSYTPLILKAEGQFWVRQDWLTVCQGDTEVPVPVQVYCPGG